MPPRMIRVRNKKTGDTALVSERAFKHFAGYYERVDQPAEQPADKPGQPADAPAPQAPAPAVEPSQPKNPARRAAASTEKE